MWYLRLFQNPNVTDVQVEILYHCMNLEMDEQCLSEELALQQHQLTSSGKVREVSMAWHEHLAAMPIEGTQPSVRKLCKLKAAEIWNMLTVILVILLNLIGHWEYLSALTGIGPRQVSLVEEDILFWMIADIQFQGKQSTESQTGPEDGVYPQPLFS